MLAEKTYIQVNEVSIDSSGGDASFEFPLKIEMKSIYGFLFSTPEDTNDSSLGATVTLDLGTDTVINDSGSSGVEIDLFKHKSTSLQDNYLPFSAENTGGKIVRGKIKDAGFQTANFKKYGVKIYVLGKTQ